MPDTIAYRGLPEYIDAAADKAGLVDPRARSLAKTGWAADAVNTALSQLVERARTGTLSQVHGSLIAESLDNVDAVIKALDAQSTGLKAAASDVKAIVGEPDRLDTPKDDRKPVGPISPPKPAAKEHRDSPPAVKPVAVTPPAAPKTPATPPAPAPKAPETPKAPAPTPTPPAGPAKS